MFSQLELFKLHDEVRRSRNMDLTQLEEMVKSLEARLIAAEAWIAGHLHLPASVPPTVENEPTQESKEEIAPESE